MAAKMIRLVRSCAIHLTLAGAWVAPAQAQTGAPSTPAPFQAMSLEDLLNVEVTSVARKPQSLSDSAAAVFVLTRADIRRSGATTIPDVLRTVPGLDVARIDASKWAVSARGSNGRFANRLLVLVDGRSVYTQLFGGVFWESLEVPLEEVAQIEIIRGPGGTLWGANAVNGVINIITGAARDSEGALASATIDAMNQATGTLRYGARIGSDAAARIYARTTSRRMDFGRLPSDDMRAFSTGVRIDRGDAQNGLSVLGDVQVARGGQTLSTHSALPTLPDLTPDTIRTGSGSAMLSLRRQLAPNSSLAARASFADSSRTEFFIGSRQRTIDLDLTHRVGAGDHQELMWGMGYRSTSDHLRDSALVRFNTPRDSFRLFSAFLQDEVQVARARTRVTVGTKVEHNSYTGFEFQPSARVLWTPTREQSVWAAVSRAVRNPTRIETGGDVTLLCLPATAEVPLPTLVTFQAGPYLQSEVLVAVEGGYRRRFGQAVSLDLAAYSNRFHHTLSGRTGEPSLQLGPDGPMILQPLVGSNDGRLAVRGLEASIEVRPTPRVRLVGSMSLMDDEAQVTELPHVNADAYRRASIRGQLDLPFHIELDPVIRAVSAVPALNVPGYTALDLHVGRPIHRQMTLSVTGQNLLGGTRYEARPTVVNTTAAPIGRVVTLATRVVF